MTIPSETRNNTASLPPEKDAIDLTVVDRIVKQCGQLPRSTIPILQAIQEHFRYLPREALQYVSTISEISPAQIAGVATFYSQFRHMPVGKHLISVCHGTACHVAGAQAITDSIRRYLGLGEDEDTDPAKRFTAQKVACLGCCSLAPVMRIDDRTFGHLTADTTPAMLEKFLREGDDRSRDGHIEAFPPSDTDGDAIEVRIGLGSCCIASGSLDVKEALEAALNNFGAKVTVKCGGCVGMCHRVPLVEIATADGDKQQYGNVAPNAVRDILRQHMGPVSALRLARDTLCRAGEFLFDDTPPVKAHEFRIEPESSPVKAFLEKQVHIVLEGCGEMDPVSIDEYRQRGGFQALETCVTDLTPDMIIGKIEASGLRGRGGAGFPTGTKWQSVHRIQDPKKYVIMNGDEGDPGAFMDRMLLESYPHRVIEGLAIAAYAVGADEGYLYIRAEYPLAVQRVQEAIRLATENDFLGERILGTTFSLKLHIMEGAGAFVCGEETGLLSSIEGRRGMPQFRPPYPAEKGLWGCPTNVNNVETYATVPWIIRNGPEALAKIGTDTSKGTKVFALAGRIVRGGLIEVPMGITIGAIVDDIGGGIRDERSFKAVQIGGPSGGCIPATLRDTRIDYEAIANTGAIMGSGGLVVMDDKTCMVDIARYFLQFTQNESCGKCTFCRIGTKRMLEILDRLCEGEGADGDIEELQRLSDQIRTTSLCGLGQTAPNPVLTTLRYFREEYEAHIAGKCPAKYCPALIQYSITDKCVGCTLCAQHCPGEAIDMRPYEQHEIDQKKCIRCGTCASVCPVDAVEVE